MKVSSIHAEVLEIIFSFYFKEIRKSEIKRSIYSSNLRPLWKTYKSVALFISERYLLKLFDRKFDEKLFDII